MILIAVVIGLFIITGVFTVIYGFLGATTGELELRSYSQAEIKTLDNELYAILFGNSSLDDLIIEGEVLERKDKIDLEVNKALRRYKGQARVYSFIIDYKDKGNILYGTDLKKNLYVKQIESSLKLPSLKNEFIEVKLLSALPVLR